MADKVVKTVPVPNSNSKKLKLTLNADEMVVEVKGFINEELVQTYLLAYPMSEQDATEKYMHFTRYS